MLNLKNLLFLASYLLCLTLNAQITYTHGSADGNPWQAYLGLGSGIQGPDSSVYLGFGNREWGMIKTNKNGVPQWGVGLELTASGPREIADHLLHSGGDLFSVQGNTLIKQHENNGNLYWIKEMPYLLPSSLNEIASGDLVVGGGYDSLSAPNYPILMQMDTAGTVSWAYTLDLSNHSVQDLETTSGGRHIALIGGDTTRVVGFDDQGQILWAKRYAGQAKRMIKLGENRLLLGGSSSNGSFVIEIDTLGNLLQSHAYTSANPHYLVDIAKAPNGGFYSLNYYGVNRSVIYFCRFDSSGNQVWGRAAAFTYTLLDRTEFYGCMSMYNGDLMLLGETEAGSLPPVVSTAYAIRWGAEDTLSNPCLNPSPVVFTRSSYPLSVQNFSVNRVSKTLSFSPFGPYSLFQFPVYMSCFNTAYPPVAQFTYTQSSPGQLSLNSSGSQYASSFQWDFGDGNSSNQANPSHAYAAAGTYTVCLIASNSNSADTTCQTVTISCTSPILDFTASSNLLNAQFTTQWPTTVLSHSWDFGDGNTSTQANPSHSFASPGTYTVCLTAQDSCDFQTICKTVTITCPLANPNFTYGSSNLFAVFTDLSSGTITSRLWDFGDGNTSTLQNPGHTYASPGTYNVCLTTTNSCGNNTICQTVTVTCPLATPSFSHSTNLFDATFTPTFATSGLSLLWDFGDGNTSTQTNPSHTYSNPGSYMVCLIASNSCASDTICNPITIVCASPNPSFTATVNNLDVSFNSSVNTGSVSYQWDFGDGNSSTSANPSHTYLTAGVYTVCLIASNPCRSDTVCDTVYAGCQPLTAGFSSNITNGATVYFTDQSSNGSTWFWDFGDGATSTIRNPNHTYANPGTYTVCQIIQDPCAADTFCSTLTITCVPFQVSYTTAANGQVIFFYSNNSDPGVTVNWNFGDASSGSGNVTGHFYASPGYYFPCATATDACGTSSYCDTIAVGCPAPVADFGYSGGLLTLHFTNQSLGDTTRIWDFGDGNTSTALNPSHTYASGGSYTVCLTANSACGSDTQCYSVSVTDPRPTAGFTFSVSGLSLLTTNTSSPNSFWFEWDFGDGNTSTANSPSHTYASAGTYNVCLIASNSNAADTLCQLVAVTPILSIPGLEFEGWPEGNSAYLRWDIDRENDIESYQLQYKSAPNDYRNIAAFPVPISQGNSSKAYAFRHKQVVSGANLYRLQIRYRDGSIAFSEAVELYFEDNLSAKIKIWPNPSGSGQALQVELPQGYEKGHFRLYNQTGQLIYEHRLRNQRSLMVLPDIPAGMYTYTLQSGQDQFRGKVLRQ